MKSRVLLQNVISGLIVAFGRVELHNFLAILSIWLEKLNEGSATWEEFERYFWEAVSVTLKESESKNDPNLKKFLENILQMIKLG